MVACVRIQTSLALFISNENLQDYVGIKSVRHHSASHGRLSCVLNRFTYAWDLSHVVDQKF